MYYSSGNYEAFARPKKPEGVDSKSAYIVGSGLAALTAACYLVRGRRPALRHQPLPAARRGDHDRGAVVLPPFERRDVVYRLAGAPVLIFFRNFAANSVL